MKAILEYSLPEDREDLDLALRGAEYQAVIVELDTYLRNVLKHEEPPEQVATTMQDIRDKIHEECIERNLGLW